MRITESEGCVRFTVRVQPRASRNELAGTYGDALRVRLSAPPVDGAANDALIAFLAQTFSVSSRAVRILSGATSRTKIVAIEGVSATDIEARASV